MVPSTVALFISVFQLSGLAVIDLSTQGPFEMFYKHAPRYALNSLHSFYVYIDCKL